jgi:hypothetical protein
MNRVRNYSPGADIVKSINKQEDFDESVPDDLREASPGVFWVLVIPGDQ